MTNFTPISALLGGGLIGTAASVLLWFDGRIAGVSGILSGLLSPVRGDVAWRALFLGGLVAGAALFYTLFGQAPQPRLGFPRGMLIVSGLLVGVGTGLTRGCTSGHGVCGLARLSPRSLAATLIFLIVAIVTTYCVRHIAGIAG